MKLFLNLLRYGICLSIVVFVIYNIFGYSSKTVITNSTLSRSSRLKEKMYVTTSGNPGRLGNMLFRCASLYGIAKHLGRFPYISINIIPELSINEVARTFPLFSDYFELKMIPSSEESVVVFGDDCCKYESPTVLEKYNNVKYLKLTGYYLQSFKFFVNYEQEIKDLMECSNNLKSIAKSKAERMWTGDFNSHKLCIHIRRTDFLDHPDLQGTNSNFLISATTFIYDRLKLLTPNISLFLMGDDENFIKNLKFNIQFTSVNSFGKNVSTREMDMCFAIEYCQTFLLSASSSTFGWWTAYLKKNEGNVYYDADISRTDNYSKNIHSTDLYPLHWKKLRLLKDNNVIEQNIIQVQ